MSDKDNLKEEQEIDLIEVLNIIIDKRKFIYKSILIFTIIGLLLAVFSPIQYESSTVFVPQSVKEKIGGGFGGLASLAGFSIGGTEAGISLNLYPKIVNSIPFQRELINTSLSFKGQSKKNTYKKYYEEIYTPSILEILKKYTINLPSLIITNLRKENQSSLQKDKLNDIFYISFKEYQLFNRLKSQLSLNIDKKDNFITLSVNMPEAIASAELACKAEKLLEKYIINYKIKKSYTKLEFIKKRYKEKQNIFNKKQQKLAAYQDRNRFSNTARSKAKLITLEAEYNLAFSVLSELAKQLETQKIQVKEDTPIFTIIKPASVPIKKSSPNKLIIIFICIIFGLIFSVSLIFIKLYYTEIKKKLKLYNM